MYSNCITQNEILKLLRRIHVAPSATVSELFTQFKGSFDVFKNNSCFRNMPVFHFERFRLRSLLLYSLGLWILFFFSFFLSVFHSLINSTFPNSEGLSCLYNKQKLIIHGSDMPQAVISGNLSLYADDTTVHCIGSTVDKACNQLNNALDELNKWCMTNSLTNGA